MSRLSFICKKCGEEFDCDVGNISFPPGFERPSFEKNIVCNRCGVLTMDEVELTEWGQTQLTEIYFRYLEKGHRNKENFKVHS